MRGCDALRRDEVEAKLRQGAQGYNYSIEWRERPRAAPWAHLFEIPSRVALQMLRRLVPNAGRAAAVPLYARPLCTGSKTLGTPRENWAEVCLAVSQTCSLSPFLPLL